MMNVEDLEKYQTMREKKKVMLEQLNDKGMEGRNSNGLVAAGVLEAATLKLPGRVHWSPGEKWNNLRDCMAEKGVHFFGLCRDEREGELVGWNCCQKYKFRRSLYMFWVRMPMYTCLILGQSAYVYKSWLDCLCGLRPKSLDL
jgi:hypothetical protein